MKFYSNVNFSAILLTQFSVQIGINDRMHSQFCHVGDPQMKAISRLIVLADWSVTLVMGYFLLQFGADRVSRLVSSKYVTGNYSEVDWWLTVLGIGALVSIFFLIHPNTRFYTATVLAVMLGGDSLKSLSLGDPQALLVPLMSLAAASLVLLSRKPSKLIYRVEHEEPSLTEVNLFENRA